jgi:hypothetical protein
MASISWQSFVGNLKQLIEYASMAWATALMRTSHPAWDSSFSFQPLSLCQTLSLIYVKLSALPLPINEGSPRYFSYCLIIGTFRVSFIAF